MLVNDITLNRKENTSTTTFDQNISMSAIVRKVECETKEHAIGKFVIATKDIKAEQKMDIECYDMAEIISLS